MRPAAPTLACAAKLTEHGGRSGNPVHSVSARVCRASPGTLELAYVVEGDIGRLRLPPEAAPTFAEGLWRHTCFEVFIRRGGLPAYHEFNFAPSRAWAVYAFERYRHGCALAEAAVDPHIGVRATDSTFTLETRIALSSLSPEHVNAPLALGLSAVIEDSEGALSYWALAHPSDKPDFHHPDSFVLQIQ